jgi:hypothetical protein
MTSIRFACPGEAARLRGYADQLDVLGRNDAAQLWRELADRIEARHFAEIMKAMDEAGEQISAPAPGAP